MKPPTEHFTDPIRPEELVIALALRCAERDRHARRTKARTTKRGTR